MEQDTSAQPTMTEVLASVGVIVTPEGRKRARVKLAESRRRVEENAPARREFLAQLRAGTATTA
jgi:hypothetical protein